MVEIGIRLTEKVLECPKRMEVAERLKRIATTIGYNVENSVGQIGYNDSDKGMYFWVDDEYHYGEVYPARDLTLYIKDIYDENSVVNVVILCQICDYIELEVDEDTTKDVIMEWLLEDVGVTENDDYGQVCRNCNEKEDEDY